ncbi:hypothetical protein KY319_04055 [Candidatus Woesearchaeota archaeon]|nr:hypothetical protein [Candidatus Woesearchaeota archaeon]
MRCKLLVVLAFLLLLSACAGECKTAADCVGKSRAAYTADCVDKTCVYNPIPNTCGNGLCEPPENKCSCSQDCGSCVGKVPNSQFLTQQCVQNQCVEDVAVNLVKPISGSAEQSSAGDKFKFDTIYNQPFNLKKDTFDVVLSLSQLAIQNREHRVVSMELSATTKDGRTVTLARQNVDKFLWAVGSSVSEDLILDYVTVEKEGELSNLVLKVQYEYVIVQAGKKTPRSAVLQNRYREKFVFVNPSASYPCPASCDDNNPGTKDSCGPQTDYFCRHEPIPNACGNFRCDGSENKCTCPVDCGPCSGSAGSYLEYVCKANKCTTQLKPGVVVQPSSIFDDRSLGPVQLNNNYKFTSPFDVSKDKFEFDFKVYRMDPSVSEVMIETVRLLEGTQQLAEVSVSQTLGDQPSKVSVSIPGIVEPEEEHIVSLAVWYRFVQDGKDKTGKFEKPLGKITFIRPE